MITFYIIFLIGLIYHKEIPKLCAGWCDSVYLHSISAVSCLPLGRLPVVFSARKLSSDVTVNKQHATALAGFVRSLTTFSCSPSFDLRLFFLLFSLLSNCRAPP